MNLTNKNYIFNKSLFTLNSCLSYDIYYILDKYINNSNISIPIKYEHLFQLYDNFKLYKKNDDQYITILNNLKSNEDISIFLITESPKIISNKLQNLILSIWKNNTKIRIIVDLILGENKLCLIHRSILQKYIDNTELEISDNDSNYKKDIQRYREINKNYIEVIDQMNNKIWRSDSYNKQYYFNNCLNDIKTIFKDVYSNKLDEVYLKFQENLNNENYYNLNYNIDSANDDYYI